MQLDVRDMKNVLFTDTTCLQHSHHLVSLACLKAVDKLLSTHRSWKYYASLATSSNVCRLLSRQIFEAWSNMHGYKSAKDDCKRLWPKACSGRWSGCDLPEKRFLKCTKKLLVPVLSSILTARGKQPRASNAGAVDIDELHIEESKAYSEKMTRWKKKTLEVIEDDLWWRCLAILNKSRGPLTHLSNYLQKPQGEWGHIAQLCNGKSAELAKEFLQVWQSLRECGCIAGADDDADVKFARNLAMLGF